MRWSAEVSWRRLTQGQTGLVGSEWYGAILSGQDGISGFHTGLGTWLGARLEVGAFNTQVLRW